MKTITVNSKEFCCRQYTISELKELFRGYIVALEDEEHIDMSNISGGVLVDVFDIEQKNAKQEQHLLEGKKYFYLDLTAEPLILGSIGV